MPQDLADRHRLVKNIGEASPRVKKGLGVFITNIGNMKFFFNTIVTPASSGGYGVKMIKVSVHVCVCLVLHVSVLSCTATKKVSSLPSHQESLVSYSLAMGTPSQSPLKYHLDQAISKVYEAGLSTYWKQRSYVLYRKARKSQHT